jgi:hypothetical protein
MGEPTYSSTILDLGTGAEWSASCLRRFTAGESAPSTHWIEDRRLCGPQSPSGRCGIDKHLLTLPGIEPRPSSQ